MNNNLHLVSEEIPKMITIQQAVEMFPNCTYHFFRSGCMSGKIVHVKSGNKFLINLDRLIEYFREGENINEQH